MSSSAEAEVVVTIEQTGDQGAGASTDPARPGGNATQREPAVSKAMEIGTDFAVNLLASFAYDAVLKPGLSGVELPKDLLERVERSRLLPPPERPGGSPPPMRGSECDGRPRRRHD